MGLSKGGWKQVGIPGAVLIPEEAVYHSADARVCSAIMGRLSSGLGLQPNPPREEVKTLVRKRNTV